MFYIASLIDGQTQTGKQTKERMTFAYQVELQKAW